MFKKMNNIYIFLSIIIVISLNEKNTVLEFCDINLYCNSCTLCGNGTNEYTLCSYYNLFCTEKFSNRVNFQESFLEKYSKFFRNISNANEFCGQEKYNLDSVINSFSIINKSNKKIKSDNHIKKVFKHMRQKSKKFICYNCKKDIIFFLIFFVIS